MLMKSFLPSLTFQKGRKTIKSRLENLTLIFLLQFFNRWKGIAIVGGDGTFYEVLNGIYSRPDWQEVFQQIPLGAIPGGSGNGLSRYSTTFVNYGNAMN
jgi:diacylglycerol kinase family enzyme